MHIVKLDAVDSTNRFLKDLCHAADPDNFTVITARNQTAGRGQMGATWVSEPGQNLTFSVLLRDLELPVGDQFVINIAVSVAIVSVLLKHHIADTSIKWPNDILAGKKKVGGILIENVISGSSFYTIAGIGLNVNQVNFEGFPRAGSLKCATLKSFDLDLLLNEILESLRYHIGFIHEPDYLLTYYLGYLFNKDRVAVFRQGTATFNGIIRGITPAGELIVETEDKMHHFRLKEVEMQY